MEPIPGQSQSQRRNSSAQQQVLDNQRNSRGGTSSSHHSQHSVNLGQSQGSHASAPVLDTSLQYQAQGTESGEYKRSQNLLRQIREREAQMHMHAMSHQSDLHRAMHPHALTTSQLLRQSINDAHIPDDQYNHSPIGRHLTDSHEFVVHEHGRESPFRKHPTESMLSQPSVVDIPLPLLDLQQMKYAERLIKDNQHVESKLQQAQKQLLRIQQDSTKMSQLHADLFQQTQKCQHELHSLDRTKHEDLNLVQKEIHSHKANNQLLQTTITKVDGDRVEAVKRLRFLQQKREFTHTDFEERKTDVHNKLSIIKQTEAQREFAAAKLDRVQRQIQALQVSLLNESRDVADDQCLLERLLKERESLMEKLNDLNETYIQCVNDTVADKKRTAAHMRRQSQILASKNICKVLQALCQKNKQIALNDFIFYCEFDGRCHRALSQFAVVLERVGRAKLTIGIKKWFQNTFDPVATNKQILRLTTQYCRQRQVSKVWGQMKQRMFAREQRMRRYQFGFSRMGKSMARDRRLQKNRIKNIWLSERRATILQKIALRKVIMRQYCSRRIQAFRKWQNFSHHHKMLAISQTLITQHTLKMYKNQVFMSLKEYIDERKRKRQRQRGKFFKGFGDGITYLKFMKVMDSQTDKLITAVHRRTLAQVFFELKCSKEFEKYRLMFDKLHNHVQPAINRLQLDFEDLAQKALLQKRLRGLRCLARYSLTGAGGYFLRWKKMNRFIRDQSGAVVFAHLLRQYRAILHMGVLQWRNGVRWRKLTDAQRQYDEYIRKQREIKKLIQALTRHIKDENYRQEAFRQRKLQAAIEIFNRRTQQVGLQKWATRCRLVNHNLDKGHLLIKYKWKQLMRSALKQFKAKIELQKQDEKDARREVYYVQVRKDRLTRTCYNALAQFCFNFKLQKRYWTIVTTHMDMWIKRRTKVRWQESVNETKIQELQEQQNIESKRFDWLNALLGSKVSELESLHSHCKLLKKLLTEQGQRVLSNAFARFYYNKAWRGIKKWKDRVAFEKQRETYLRNQIRAQITNGQRFVKAAFENWNSMYKQNTLNAKTKQEEVQIDDQIRLNEHNRKLAKQLEENLKDQIFRENEHSESLRQRKENIKAILEQRNSRNNYQLSLRFLFDFWKQHIRNQRRLITAIKVAIQKDAWKQGFAQIQAVATAKYKLGLKVRCTVGMRRMCYKKMFGSAFCIWRESMFVGTKTVHNQVSYETSDVIQQHDEWKERVVDTNMQRCERVIKQKKLANCLQAWRVVHKWLLHKKWAQKALEQRWLSYLAKRTCVRWHTFTHNQNKKNTLLQELRLKQKMITQKAVFNALQQVQRNENRYYYLLQLVAQKFDKRVLESAFHRIDKFQKSRRDINKQSRRDAALHMGLALNEVYRRVKTDHFQHFYKNASRWNIKVKRIAQCFKYWEALRKRDMFLTWKKQAKGCTYAEEINKHGPVVEEVLDQRMRLNLMKKFMQDQAYTKNEISKVEEITQARVNSLLSVGLAHISHQHEDIKFKPIAFDRWKLYVKMRKLLRFIMRNVENQLQPEKSDMSICFNRWRRRTQNQLIALNGKDRQNLVQIATNYERRLEGIDESGYHKHQELVQYRQQRDDLFEAYVKSQKLTCALGRDNHLRSQHQAMNQLRDFTHKSKRYELDSLLKRNVNLLSQIKERTAQLDFENQSMARDNEELRQQSLNGFVIAKDAVQLSDDRERLSIDLADKVKQINQLLGQNDALVRQLHDTQVHNDLLADRLKR